MNTEKKRLIMNAFFFRHKLIIVPLDIHKISLSRFAEASRSERMCF